VKRASAYTIAALVCAGCSRGPVPSSHAASVSAPGGDAAADAPAPKTARGPMNVILVSVDCLRNDMPWNGYPRDIAPHLSALEKRSVSYDHAYAISSFTAKSVGPLLASNYPSAMTRDGVFFTRYFNDNVMFPVVLEKAGVATLSAHTHMYLAKGRGFDRGFTDYRIVDGISFDYNKDPYITSQKLTPLAISMLTQWAPKAPFFAWFHYMDPHDVYLPHKEFPSFGKKARDLYDGEVRFTDEWIGKLLDFVEESPWGKNTVVIFTGDHGEAFGEHGMYRHAHELWEELVHVPLFFLVPGVAARHVAVARGAVDLGPTILDFLRVDRPKELRGESLVPEIVEGKDGPPRPVVCDLTEDTYNERRRAVIDDGRKIISFGKDVRYEIYDLKNDPGEKNNLLKKDPDLAKAMIARYKEVSKTIPEVAPRGGIVRPPE
jgi:choline-sulfatase